MEQDVFHGTGMEEEFLCFYGHFGQNWQNDSGRLTIQTISAKEAKYHFGKLIDTARAEPVTVEKHGRAVVVVLAVEEHKRLKGLDNQRVSIGVSLD